MSLISLLAAFIIEQFRPLNYGRWVETPLRSLARLAEDRLNAGAAQHGLIAWLCTVGGLMLVALAVYLVLAWFNPLFALAWNVLILYFTLGFRQFSHHFTEIHLALRMGDVVRARSLLADWRGASAEQYSSSDVARLAIEQALVASHRHVFAVVLWFVLLPGPIGAILYRASLVVADTWQQDVVFGAFARRAFMLIDWLPQRVTAVAFAIVGNFEDAVHCWRTQAAQWPDPASGIVLAAGAGALGVRLGMPVVEDGLVTDRQDLGAGDEADVDFMQSAVGLVWRALVLWLLLLFMLTLASLLG